jgi:hypothetical protein
VGTASGRMGLRLDRGVGGMTEGEGTSGEEMARTVGMLQEASGTVELVERPLCSVEWQDRVSPFNFVPGSRPRSSL